MILKKPVNVRDAIKEAKDKGFRRANKYLANLAVPLLEPDSHYPEEVKLCKTMLQKLVNENSNLVKRPTLFETLCALGVEPVDIKDTVMGEVVSDRLPIRTKAEAWEIALANMPLLKKAIRYNRLDKIPGSKNVDIESIARIEMFKTALYWDPDKGAFSTYLFQNLRRCSRAIRMERGLVRFPEHVSQGIAQFQMYMRKYGATKRRYAKITGLPMAKVDKLARYAQLLDCSTNPIPLSTVFDSEPRDYTINKDGDGRKDTIRLKDIDPELLMLMKITPYEEFSEIDLFEKAQIILKTLNFKEERILKLRFGIELDDQLTLEDVGKIFFVTRERIRQIEAQALRKMCHPLRSGKLKGFIET